MREGPPTEPTPATHEEIEAAIRALTRTQLLRLASFAWFSHRALGSRGAGRNEGDLLSDAIIATLEGRRKWIKDNCDFPTFLKGVMRSMTSHIRNGKATDAFDAIAPRPASEHDDAEDLLEQIPTSAPVDPERQLLARDLDKQIRERFANDVVVLLVYDAFQDKMKPVDIQSCLDITENEYNAAAKRLRRAVRGFAKGRPR